MDFYIVWKEIMWVELRGQNLLILDIPKGIFVKIYQFFFYSS